MQGKVFTYGCKLNQAESALWRENIKKNNVIVINACSVTSYATKEIRKKIRKVRRENPGVVVYVTGCMDTTIVKTAIENKCYVVDRVFMDKLFSTNIYSYPDNSRAFIIIQKGCNRFCRYCIVPYLRGDLLSVPHKKIMDEIYKMYDDGYREFVLTGTHIGLYRYEGLSLSDLLERLYKEFNSKNIRVRLGSLEVFEIDEKLKELYKESFICNHIHLSVQSFDDRVLRFMGRTYTLSDIERVIEYFSSINVFIGVDVIVGYPLEREEMFNNSVDIMKSWPISFFHVFRYSPREYTVGALFKKYDNDEIVRRLKIVKKIVEIKREESLKRLPINEEVIVEKIENGIFTGRLSNYMVGKGKVSSGMRQKGLYRVKVFKEDTINKGGDYVIVSVEG